MSKEGVQANIRRRGRRSSGNTEEKKEWREWTNERENEIAEGEFSGRVSMAVVVEWWCAVVDIVKRGVRGWISRINTTLYCPSLLRTLNFSIILFSLSPHFYIHVHPLLHTPLLFLLLSFFSQHPFPPLNLHFSLCTFLFFFLQFLFTLAHGVLHTHIYCKYIYRYFLLFSVDKTDSRDIFDSKKPRWWIIKNKNAVNVDGYEIF